MTLNSVLWATVEKLALIVIVLIVILVSDLCFAAGQQAETGSAVAGRRRGSGGRRLPRAWAESAATRLSGAESLKRPSLRETESERGNGTESGRGRKRRRMMRKKKRSYWNLPGSAAPTLRTTTPMIPWTKWYCYFCLDFMNLCSVASCFNCYNTLGNHSHDLFKIILSNWLAKETFLFPLSAILSSVFYQAVLKSLVLLSSEVFQPFS